MSQAHAIANLILAYGPFIMALLITASISIASGSPTLFRILSLLVCAIGFCLFFVAKLSVFRQGIFVSFGSRQMTRRHRWMYWMGYSLIGIGWLLGIGAVLAGFLSR